MAIAIRSNSQISYSILPAGAFTATLAVREIGPAGAPKPRLLDRVREAIRARHYSRGTTLTEQRAPAARALALLAPVR